MRITNEGIALIKEFEGFRARAYKDAVGVWTIGYGHTSMAGSPIVAAGLVISEAEGEAILRRDIALFANGVAAKIKTELNPQQFSALVSFAFNVGLGNFAKSSVLVAVNSGKLDRVPGRLALWNKAGGKVLPGLTRRRKAEGDLFLKPWRETSKPVDPSPVEAPASVEASPRAGAAGRGEVAAGGGGAVIIGGAAVAVQHGVDWKLVGMIAGFAILAGLFAWTVYGPRRTK